MHFCPHTGCDYRGWLGLNNLRANGHPSGGPWRQLHCTACEGYFPEHHGTIFHGKQAAVELIVRVLACLAEGLGIRATARVFEVAPNTVLHWLVEAAEQLRAFSAYFLCDLHLEQLQLDELYAVLRDLKAGAISDDEAISASGAFTVLGVDGDGPHEQAAGGGRCRQPHPGDGAARGASGDPVLAPGCVPLFLTDGLKDYATALLTHFGQWMHPARRQDKGPMPKPRWMPLPELLYAQVVKSYRRRRLVGVKHRVVFGTQLAIEQVLAACGWTINTAFVERLNLDIRQRVAAIGRRVNTLCQGEAGLRDQLALFQVYHNFVVPHPSLPPRVLLPGHQRLWLGEMWWPCTPAMTAGLTGCVWSLKEVLLYRVPPWSQPQPGYPPPQGGCAGGGAASVCLLTDGRMRGRTPTCLVVDRLWGPPSRPPRGRRCSPPGLGRAPTPDAPSAPPERCPRRRVAPQSARQTRPPGAATGRVRATAPPVRAWPRSAAALATPPRAPGHPDSWRGSPPARRDGAVGGALARAPPGGCPPAAVPAGPVRAPLPGARRTVGARASTPQVSGANTPNTVQA